MSPPPIDKEDVLWCFPGNGDAMEWWWGGTDAYADVDVDVPSIETTDEVVSYGSDDESWCKVETGIVFD